MTSDELRFVMEKIVRLELKHLLVSDCKLHDLFPFFFLPANFAAKVKFIFDLVLLSWWLKLPNIYSVNRLLAYLISSICM